MTQPLRVLERSADAKLGCEECVDAPWRILVIDDHAVSRTVACYALGLRGYRCEGVATAAAAISSVDLFKPHIVMLEWNLRDGSGLGLGAELRRHARVRGRSLLVIAVSTQDEPSGFRDQESVDAYFTKPLAMKELDALFVRALCAVEMREPCDDANQPLL